MNDLVIFENSGEIDTRLISSFGVNVKENDSPTGYFGTGMKYALAILMRENVSVEIAIGERLLKVGTSEQTIRGVKFSFITLGDEVLNFTTELGKNWELWMAYRELYTNCMDEEGQIYSVDVFYPEEGKTKIVVSGEDFIKLHNNKGQYFLDQELAFDGEDVAIHKGTNSALFFRNIRVIDLPIESLSVFSYNLKEVELTEDRTLKNTWAALRDIAHVWARCTDSALIERSITSPRGTFEHALDYDRVYDRPTDEFMAVANRVAKERFTDINPTVARLVAKYAKPAMPDIVELDSIQEVMLTRAIAFWRENGFDIETYQIKPVKSLGERTLGLAKDGIIYVSLEAFESGVKQLAITLFEEYIHLEHSVFDESRGMQEKLLHIIIKLAEKNIGEPL